MVDLETEQRRHLDGYPRGDGETEHDERFRARGLSRLVARGGRDDELLPQPLGVLACKFARQRIEAAHALDRDEESLVARQTCLGERRHLLAEVVLELRDVGPMYGPPATQVLAPVRDLFLERRGVGEHRHAGHAFIQIPRSVPSTTSHCCFWTASCARPSSVML